MVGSKQHTALKGDGKNAGEKGKGGLLLSVRRSSFPFHLGGRDNRATRSRRRSRRRRMRRRRRPTISHATYRSEKAGMEEGGGLWHYHPSIPSSSSFCSKNERENGKKEVSQLSSSFGRRSSSPLPPSAARSRSLFSLCENVCQSVRDPFQSSDPPRLLLLFPRLFRRMPPRLRGELQDRRREKTFLPTRKRGKSFIFGFRHFLARTRIIVDQNNHFVIKEGIFVWYYARSCDVRLYIFFVPLQ